MKQLEKLERELAKAGLGEHVYDGAKLRMIEKINELVDAFNELNMTKLLKNIVVN